MERLTERKCNGGKDVEVEAKGGGKGGMKK